MIQLTLVQSHLLPPASSAHGHTCPPILNVVKRMYIHPDLYKKLVQYWQPPARVSITAHVSPLCFHHYSPSRRFALNKWRILLCTSDTHASTESTLCRGQYVRRHKGAAAHTWHEPPAVTGGLVHLAALDSVHPRPAPAAHHS